MHTHDASGIIHVEATSLSNQYTLGAFFTVWRLTFPNGATVTGVARPIMLSSPDILGLKIGQAHRLSLLLDTWPSTHQNSTHDGALVLPHSEYFPPPSPI